MVSGSKEGRAFLSDFSCGTQTDGAGGAGIVIGRLFYWSDSDLTCDWCGDGTGIHVGMDILFLYVEETVWRYHRKSGRLFLKPVRAVQCADHRFDGKDDVIRV